ncbi:MAG: hypothetical protein FWF44_04385 [Defluviitaleaceae bacterium]|nr:hypothetical protein [Defluviitaleaceae bacterium]
MTKLKKTLIVALAVAVAAGIVALALSMTAFKQKEYGYGGLFVMETIDIIGGGLANGNLYQAG